MGTFLEYGGHDPRWVEKGFPYVGDQRTRAPGIPGMRSVATPRWGGGVTPALGIEAMHL